MKRYLMTILAAMLTTLSLKAMPYEMAREEAMYLTDKMAYELNLNDRQYEYAYEINLDYLMGLNRAEDAYGMYLTFRNADLRHILYDWQWRIFASLDYFFRPVSWRYGTWYYPIYTHYARNYYYYSRPAVYRTYRGGHSRSYYGNSFYADRRPRWESGFRGSDRGHFGNNQNTRPGYHIEGMHPGMNNGRPNMNENGRPGREENGSPEVNNNDRRPNNSDYTPNHGRPNMGNTTSRGNMDMPNRGNMTTPSRGNTTPSRSNMTTPSRGNTNMSTRGNVSTPSRSSSNMGTSTRSTTSAASAGRGHAGNGRGGR